MRWLPALEELFEDLVSVGDGVSNMSKGRNGLGGITVAYVSVDSYSVRRALPRGLPAPLLWDL